MSITLSLSGKIVLASKRVYSSRQGTLFSTGSIRHKLKVSKLGQIFKVISLGNIVHVIWWTNNFLVYFIEFCSVFRKCYKYVMWILEYLFLPGIWKIKNVYQPREEKEPKSYSVPLPVCFFYFFLLFQGSFPNMWNSPDF